MQPATRLLLSANHRPLLAAAQIYTVQPSSKTTISTTVRFIIFSGTISTAVTINSTTVTQWISYIKMSHSLGQQPLIVDLDTEWGPAACRNPIATVQLCVGRRCLIYQISHSPYVPQSLAEFLSDKNCRAGVMQDLQKLCDEYGVGGGARYVDLQRMAADLLLGVRRVPGRQRWICCWVFDLEELLRASTELLGKGTAYKAAIEVGTMVAVKSLVVVAVLGGEKESRDERERERRRDVAELEFFF